MPIRITLWKCFRYFRFLIVCGYNSGEMHFKYHQPRPMPLLFNEQRIISPSTKCATINPNEKKHTGNNGNIQLWQFLMNTLLAVEHQDKIRWLCMEYSEEGIFDIVDKVAVASMWRRVKGVRTSVKRGEASAFIL